MKPCGDCVVEPIERKIDLSSVSFEKLVVAHLEVGGMGCRNCAIRVRNSLVWLEGVFLAQVDLEEEKAQVAFDPDIVSPDKLLMAVSIPGSDGKHRYWPNLISMEPMHGFVRVLIERVSSVNKGIRKEIQQ